MYMCMHMYTQTPFAKHFDASSLQPHKHVESSMRLKKVISSKTSLKFISNMSAMAARRERSEFVCICVAVCCSALKFIQNKLSMAARGERLSLCTIGVQFVAVRCSMLQCVAVRCSALQHAAV